MRWDRGIFNGSNANFGWVVGKFILLKVGLEIKMEKKDLNLKQLLWGNDGICHQHLKEHTVFPMAKIEDFSNENECVTKRKNRGYFTWI
jgi:hypothetical protein